MSPTADSQPKPAVLIAGSGPSGLILALTLVKNDIPVRIIEKDSEFHEGQRGSGVQPRTLEVFNYLGCLDDMLKKAKPAEPRAVYKLPEGVEIAKIVEMAPYIPPTPSVPYRNPVIHGQASSEAVLRTHLAKYNIFVELETELVDFQQNPDSVTAHVVKRSGGKEVRETLTVDWLVGADGAHSFVRNKLGLTFLGETRPAESIIIADVEVKGLSTDYWHSWGDQSTKSVWLRPTETPGVFHLMAGGKQADLATMQQGREQIIKYILDVTNRHDLEFREVKFVKEWRPNIRIVNKFSEGRVFVIGDAGHVHSPTGGQGMNTGVQDAFNLAWKLALVIKGLARPSILESYTPERLPVVRQMLDRTTELLAKTLEFRADGSNTAGFLRPPILHMLGVHCRASPIVVDEQPEAGEAAQASAYCEENPAVLYAGDRAPDAPALRVVARGGAGAVGEDVTSLFKIFGPTHHTALLFAPSANDAGLQSVVDSLHTLPNGTVTTVVVLPQGVADATSQTMKGADLVVVDTLGHAATAYPPAAKGYPVILVRPDGVVGAVVRGEEGVKQYCAKIFV